MFALFVLAEGELIFVRMKWPFHGEKLILMCGYIASLELQLKWIISMEYGVLVDRRFHQLIFYVDLLFEGAGLIDAALGSNVEGDESLM